METIIFLLFFGFITAFVDSIAGGGGLISVPALLSVGLSPQMVLGTNKLQGSIASVISSYEYIRSGKVNRKLMIRIIPLVVIGASFGVVTVRVLPNEWLKPIIVVLLVFVLAYTLLKKDFGKFENPKPLTIGLLSYLMVMCTIIGFYDGFFGPGTGAFLLFVFLFTGVNFVSAQANAKILNTTSNIVSLIIFIKFGYVHYQYGLVMAASGIVGAIVGTKVAVTKGSMFVKPLFFIMTVWLIFKQILSFFG
ncbi:TSUP family transporter [Bacillus sp. BRMEA1]|uniref:TSUP family transporter n=1 Tax=Neobacillus endophyticus TaxID=2738405 RepID=UPI001566A10B|nr:TSUP family transporter [Neobacillus endophyticus]NRD80083.1 TSUP family transporter [Neobacillus endophyticus]